MQLDVPVERIRTPVLLTVLLLVSALSVLGGDPAASATTSAGPTAYVCNYSASTVTPVDISTNTAGTPISLDGGLGPNSIAITPDAQDCLCRGHADEFRDANRHCHEYSRKPYRGWRQSL